MAVTTPNDLLTLALKDGGIVGVGQTPKAEDMNDAFDRLNMMIAQWRRKRWLVYRLVSTSKVSTGASSYTVGTGGDFNIARPDRIEDAFLRLLNTGGANPVDYPLRVLQSREDYNQIATKSLNAWPEFVFYDPTLPNGTLYPWPIAAASIYEIHISTKVDLPAFTSLAQQITLPEEYKAGILYNMAVRLRAAYRLPPDETLNGLAKDALNVIRGANTAIAQLRMPMALSRGPGYDVYSDRG